MKSCCADPCSRRLVAPIDATKPWATPSPIATQTESRGAATKRREGAEFVGSVRTRDIDKLPSSSKLRV